MSNTIANTLIEAVNNNSNTNDTNDLPLNQEKPSEEITNTLDADQVLVESNISQISNVQEQVDSEPKQEKDESANSDAITEVLIEASISQKQESPSEPKQEQEQIENTEVNTQAENLNQSAQVLIQSAEAAETNTHDAQEKELKNQPDDLAQTVQEEEIPQILVDSTVNNIEAVEANEDNKIDDNSNQKDENKEQAVETSTDSIAEKNEEPIAESIDEAKKETTEQSENSAENDQEIKQDELEPKKSNKKEKSKGQSSLSALLVVKERKSKREKKEDADKKEEKWFTYKIQKDNNAQYETKDEDIFNETLPKNTAIEVDDTTLIIPNEVKVLGVVRVDPEEYIRMYSSELLQASEFPEFIQNIAPPLGERFASEYNNPYPLELEGDLEALKYVDLEKEGLGEYRDFLVSKGVL